MAPSHVMLDIAREVMLEIAQESFMTTVHWTTLIVALEEFWPRANFSRSPNTTKKGRPSERGSGPAFAIPPVLFVTLSRLSESLALLNDWSLPMVSSKATALAGPQSSGLSPPHVVRGASPYGGPLRGAYGEQGGWMLMYEPLRLHPRIACALAVRYIR